MENSSEEVLREQVLRLERQSRLWRRVAVAEGLIGAVVVLSALALGLAWSLAPEVEEPPRPSPGMSAPGAVEAGEPQGSDDFHPEIRGRRMKPVKKFPIEWISANPQALAPPEMVLGVVVGGESRAYPLNMLTGPRRELLNDTLGGQPIVVTWCPLCHDAVVYSRVVEDRTLTFGVAGLLWNENMVMYDEETESLWVQMGGEAMSGPMKGRVLRQVPSVVTDWKSWSATHPDGTVVSLTRTYKDFRRDSYRNLQDFVLAIASGGRAKAWTFEALGKTPVIPTDWEGRPAVVMFDPSSVTARLFERTLNDRVLSFRLDDGHLADQETGSRWDPVTGRATSGPLAGQSLSPLPAIVADREHWLKFHPRSEVDGTQAAAPSEGEDAKGQHKG